MNRRNEVSSVNIGVRLSELDTEKCVQARGVRSVGRFESFLLSLLLESVCYEEIVVK